MEIYTINQAKKNLDKLLDCIDYAGPAYIVGKNNKAVMLSLEEFNAMKETIYLLSIPGMAESLHKGIAEPIEECGSTLEW